MLKRLLLIGAVAVEQNATYVPPALRAAKPKHAASRSHTAKRVAGGAVVSAALATGFAGLGSLTGLNTGIAQAACAPDDFLCQATEGGAELFGGGDGSLFGAGVGATANAFGTFDALDPLNLVGPGGSLIGNGADGDPGCTTGSASCNGQNSGLLFGNGGRAYNGGTGGNAGLIGNGGAGGNILVAITTRPMNSTRGAGRYHHGPSWRRRRQGRFAIWLGRCRRQWPERHHSDK